MKSKLAPTRSIFARSAAALLVLCALHLQCLAFDLVGTDFTYQGRLTDSGGPVTGVYDLSFSIYASADISGVLVAGPITNSATGVTNGLFTVTLDFGTNVFNLAARWLEIGVRSNGATAFVTLAPRQKITPTPYAITALNAAFLLGDLPASQLTGTIPPALLPAGVVTNNQSGVNFSGSFTGNAAGLTNLNVESLALTATNISIVGWGSDGGGEATPPAGLSNVTAVAAGGGFSLALRNDGTVVAWGYNGLGETNVPAGLNNVTAVAAGSSHSLALKNDGTVVAWGDNTDGQTNVPAGLNNVTAVAAGSSHNLALKSDSTVVTWGNNNLGQTNVPAGLNNVMAVAAGTYHNLALKNDGTVVAWGNNDVGQTNVPAGLSNVTAVAAGFYHSLALKNDGTVVVWGDNSFGQTNFPTGLNNVTAVAAGIFHSLALKSDGTVVAWGANGYYPIAAPVTLNSVVALATGSSTAHALAIRKQARSPVAWLGLNNLFEKGIQVNGPLVASNVWAGGNLTVGGDVSAAGNMTVSPPSSLSFGATQRQMINLFATAYGIGVQSYRMYFRTDVGGGFAWFMGGSHNTTTDNPGAGGIELMRLDNFGNLNVRGIVATNVSLTSDRAAKENFRPVDASKTLEKVAALPILEWNFKGDSATRHVGPMAQDFYAAFSVGSDDKHIAVVDEGGVALAAIQGLNQKLTKELEQKQTEITKLEQRLETLEQLLNRNNGDAK